MVGARRWTRPRPPRSSTSSAACRQVDGVLLPGAFGELPEFTGALQRVAEQVLTDPAGAARATIVELAERSGTSPATVTRFCRALGFDGYADLRLGIAAETGRAPAPPAGPSTSAARSSPPTRWSGCSARSWPPTPGPCTTPPRCSTSPRSSGPPTRSPRRAGSTSTAPAAARWSARRCSSACTASASPPGPGPTCTTAWPAPRCCSAGDVALGVSHSGADPGDHRDARRGRQPRRDHDRADQLPALAARRASPTSCC